MNQYDFVLFVIGAIVVSAIISGIIAGARLWEEFDAEDYRETVRKEQEKQEAEAKKLTEERYLAACRDIEIAEKEENGGK